MRRWSFISGHTVMLLLLLGLSGYCVWVTRGLTADLNHLIADNYDKIRAIRDIRSAMTQLNARYLNTDALKQAGPVSTAVLENETKLIYDRLALIRSHPSHGSSDLGAAELERVETLVKEYFGNYRLLFQFMVTDAERRDQMAAAIFQGTMDIALRAEKFVELHEEALFARQAAAVKRGTMFGWVALAIAAFSTGVYIYTSVRLTQGVFRPLRRLRDAIQQVGERKFDGVEPLQGGEELTQIATTFNRMAGELRTYIAETDERSVEASRLSRAILEALPYPIYIVDEAFEVRLKNPRADALSVALKIPGHLPAEVRKHLDDATSVGPERIDDDLHRAVEIPLPDAPGAPTLTFLPQIFPMSDAPDTVEKWAVLLVDVSKLKQLDRARTKAIAALGHEVKTPVASVRMVLHLLLEEKIGPLTADQLELVTAGRDDCERLLAMLQALLELARFEGGRAEIKLTPIAPADLLAQAEATHAGLFRDSKGPLALESDQGVLPLVQADASHVVRVLGNFISNAAKYRTPGTTVTMRATERGDGHVRLSVRNHTSRPLSETEQVRVFEPFYRRPGESKEGSGFGLAICREIAALHRGRVGARVEGDHIEFYFDLRQVDRPRPNHPLTQLQR